MTKHFEGWRGKPYKDTKGNLTIGYGFNIADDTRRKSLGIPDDIIQGKREWTEKEALPIFDKLYEQARNDAVSYVGQETFNKLNEGQQNVITDMAYNMGLTKLNEFIKMKEAMLSGDYKTAGKELKDSNYYKQTGRRAKNNYLQIQE